MEIILDLFSDLERLAVDPCSARSVRYADKVRGIVAQLVKRWYKTPIPCSFFGGNISKENTGRFSWYSSLIFIKILL